MPGEYPGRVGQCEDLRANPRQKQLRITARQIGPPHSSPKDHVTAEKYSGFLMEKAQATRAVSWHFKDPKRQTTKLNRVTRPDDDRIGHRLDLESKSPSPEEFPVGDHRDRVFMTDDPATVPRANRLRVGNVIEMPMREQQRVDRRICEVRIRPLRGVNEEISVRSRDQKCVCVERAARKFFEPNAV